MDIDYSKKEAIIFPYKEWEILIGNKKEKVWRPLALVGMSKTTLHRRVACCLSQS